MENFTQNTVENTVENTQPVRNREIKLSELTAYVQEGKKKEDIMEIYGLNSAQVTRLMKEAKLTFRKFRRPAFTLIKDVEIQTESNTVDTQEVMEEDWN